MTLTFKRGDMPVLMVGDVAIVPNYNGSTEGVEVIHPNNCDSEVVESWEELVKVVTEYSR